MFRKFVFKIAIKYGIMYTILSTMDSTTRIVDLPDNTSVNMQQPNFSIGTMESNKRNGNMNAASNAYMPLNIHPNPYGLSPENNVMNHPVTDNYQGQPNNANVGGGNGFDMEQMMQQMMQQQQRLPSRDIPRDSTNYMQDEQIQPNYIPKPKLSNDFVDEYENLNNKKLETHEQKKYRARMLDNIIEEIQIPLFIALLFLLFQLPTLNSYMFKYFAFLPIYGDDGNMNFNGIVLKSLFFGASYYFFTNFANYISEL